jgi:DNA-binding response OmpR family regulator
MHYLEQHEGDIVRRTSLLENVWGYGNYSGSNVVDTKIRSLRKKLGDYAQVIETVSGMGYRFRRI